MTSRDIAGHYEELVFGCLMDEIGKERRESFTAAVREPSRLLNQMLFRVLQ